MFYSHVYRCYFMSIRYLYLHHISMVKTLLWYPLGTLVGSLWDIQTLVIESGYIIVFICDLLTMVCLSGFVASVPKVIPVHVLAYTFHVCLYYRFYFDL